MLGTRVVPVDAQRPVGLLLDDRDREVIDLACVLHPVNGVEILLGQRFAGVGRYGDGDGLVGHDENPLGGWMPRTEAWTPGFPPQMA